MQSPPQTFPLRPLNIGEMFDRAVTMYVQNFLTLSLVSLVIFVPLGIIQFFAVGADLSFFQNAMARPATPPVVPSWFWSVGLLALVVEFVIFPLVNAAFAGLVAKIYAGEKPTFADGIAIALRKPLRIYAITVLSLLVGGGVYLAGAFGIGIIVGFGVVFLRSAPVVAVIGFIAAGLFFLGLLYLVCMVLLAYSIAICKAVVEDMPAWTALSSSIKQLVSKREAGKAALVLLSYIAVYVGLYMIAGAIAAVALFLLKSTIIYTVIMSLAAAAFSAFTGILLTLYYFDLRARSQGFDLETEIEALPT